MVAKQPDLRPVAAEPKMPNKPSAAPATAQSEFDAGMNALGSQVPPASASRGDARVAVERLPQSVLGRATSYLNRK